MPTECICMSMILLVRSCLYDQPALAEDQAADHLISRQIGHMGYTFGLHRQDNWRRSLEPRCPLRWTHDREDFFEGIRSASRTRHVRAWRTKPNEESRRFAPSCRT